MKVTNINDTSDNTCNCEGGWLGHWEKFSGKKAGLCAVSGCPSKAVKGAHVQKDDPNDRAWYIVPVCTLHNNQRGQSVTIVEVYAPPVSANKAETCEKPTRRAISLKGLLDK